MNFKKDFLEDSEGAYTYEEYLENQLEFSLEKIKQLEEDVCMVQHDWVSGSSGVHCSRCGRWWR